MRGILNRIVKCEFASPDLEFVWQDTREQDPKDAASIDVAYVSAGIMTVNEVRAGMGLRPVAWGNVPSSAPIKKNVSEGLRKDDEEDEEDDEDEDDDEGDDEKSDSSDTSDAATGEATNAEMAESLSQNSANPFPKPDGIPDDWINKPSDTPGGIKYVDPQNSGNYVRIMPGDSNSPYPNSQAPYARWQVNGQSLDINGNPVSANTADAHIPLTNFKFDLKVYQ